MDLYEYQAKELFAQHGVPTQSGIVVDTPAAAKEAAASIGATVVVNDDPGRRQRGPRWRPRSGAIIDFDAAREEQFFINKGADDGDI